MSAERGTITPLTDAVRRKSQTSHGYGIAGMKYREDEAWEHARRLERRNQALTEALNQILALEPAIEKTDYMQGRNQGISEAAYYAKQALSMTGGKDEK